MSNFLKRKNRSKSSSQQEREYKRVKNYVGSQQLLLWFQQLTKRIPPEKLISKLKQGLPSIWTSNISDFYQPHIHETYWNRLNKDLVKTILSFLDPKKERTNSILSFVSTNHFYRNIAYKDLNLWKDHTIFHIKKVLGQKPASFLSPSKWIQSELKSCSSFITHLVSKSTFVTKKASKKEIKDYKRKIQEEKEKEEDSEQKTILKQIMQVE